MVEEGLTRPCFGGYASRSSEEKKAASRRTATWGSAPSHRARPKQYNFSRLQDTNSCLCPSCKMYSFQINKNRNRRLVIVWKKQWQFWKFSRIPTSVMTPDFRFPTHFFLGSNTKNWLILGYFLVLTRYLKSWENRNENSNSGFLFLLRLLWRFQNCLCFFS